MKDKIIYFLFFILIIGIGSFWIYSNDQQRIKQQQYETNLENKVTDFWSNVIINYNCVDLKDTSTSIYTLSKGQVVGIKIQLQTPKDDDGIIIVVADLSTGNTDLDSKLNGQLHYRNENNNIQAIGGKTVQLLFTDYSIPRSYIYSIKNEWKLQYGETATIKQVTFHIGYKTYAGAYSNGYVYKWATPVTLQLS
ncbi:MAG: hypothetical protein NTV61_10615 [Candidatus Bathyarchaeota archaeon]|nr:hypothetical protein [Candidatus Bathyarchaeota archaeon]